MYAELEARLPEIEELCRRHYVRRLALFGSALRDDFDPRRSDVDVLVDFGAVPELEYAHNYLTLIDELKAVFGRDIDLVTWKYIRNPYFQREVESIAPVGLWFVTCVHICGT